MIEAISPSTIERYHKTNSYHRPENDSIIPLPLSFVLGAPKKNKTTPFSVEATAVPSLEGVVRRQVRQLELASSLDEEEEQVLLDDGGSVKYPQKRQLNLNPFITIVTTSSVVTQFAVETTTSSLAGTWECLPVGFVACEAA